MSLASSRAVGLCEDEMCSAVRADRPERRCAHLCCGRLSGWHRLGIPLGLEVARSGWDGVLLTPESKPKRVPPPWCVWFVESPWYNFTPKYFPARGSEQLSS